VAWRTGAAFPGPAAIPAAPATTAAKVTAEADRHTGRTRRDSLIRTKFFIVSLSEWLIRRALKTPASYVYSAPSGSRGGNSFGRCGVSQGVRLPAPFTWIRLAPPPGKVRRGAVAHPELPFVSPCR